MYRTDDELREAFFCDGDIDYGFWAKLDSWHVMELICLQSGMNPDADYRNDYHNNADALKALDPDRIAQYERNLMTALRHFGGRDHGTPQVFVAFDQDKHSQLPSELVALVLEIDGTSIDSDNELKAKIVRLEAELEKANKPGVSVRSCLIMLKPLLEGKFDLADRSVVGGENARSIFDFLKAYYDGRGKGLSVETIDKIVSRILDLD